jgi:hypothetical protein
MHDKGCLYAGMFYSHKKSGQPGPITRVMCCTEEQEAALPQVLLCYRVLSAFVHCDLKTTAFAAMARAWANAHC